jgi:hypothetical protein
LGACAGEELKTKSARKSREVKRLKKIFQDVDKNRWKSAEKLAERAAFILVTLEDMEEEINGETLITEMQQGDYTITRAHPLLEKHIAMTKNYAMICKQLSDLLPEQKADATAEGREIMGFAASRRSGK